MMPFAKTDSVVFSLTPDNPVIADTDQQQPRVSVAQRGDARAIVSVICSWYSIVGDSARICYTQARTRSIVMSDAAAIRPCSTTETVDHPGSRRRSTGPGLECRHGADGN
jgi:hypothetical protein